MTIDWYIAGLTFILLHELDAIRCHEWRIFPGLSSLSDRNGMLLFMVLHVPLFYWVISASFKDSSGFRVGFDLFLIIHLGLHLLFLMHPRNEFKDWLSWTLIVSAASCALFDLLN